MDLCSQTSNYSSSKKRYDGESIVIENFATDDCSGYAKSSNSFSILSDYVYRAVVRQRSIDPSPPTIYPLTTGLPVTHTANYSVKASYNSSCTEPHVVKFQLTDECDSNFNGSFSDRNCSISTFSNAPVFEKTDCLQTDSILAVYNQISPNADVNPNH